jgi:hypothetical protein
MKNDRGMAAVFFIASRARSAALGYPDTGDR